MWSQRHEENGRDHTSHQCNGGAADTRESENIGQKMVPLSEIMKDDGRVLTLLYCCSELVNASPRIS